MSKKSEGAPQASVSSAETAIFYTHFSLLINAGLPVIESLKIMAVESKNPVVGRALLKIHDGCQAGKDLSTQMRDYPEIFTPTAVALIDAGEAGDFLDDVLERLADFYDDVAMLEKAGAD